MSATPSSREAIDRFWDAQVRWWHVVFAVLWLVTLGITLSQPSTGRGRAVEVGLLVVMAISYAVWGHRALVEEGWRGFAYLAVAWSALIALGVLDGGNTSWLLFFVLFPHVWVMLSRRFAIVASVVIVVALSVTQWVTSDHSAARLRDILITFAITLALALLLGLFTSRMVEEAVTRANVIDELRAAQSQLAAAERDRGISDERERLSREIHDTLAQGFTSVLTLTRAADAALARGDVATARERLALVDSTARDNLSEARLIVAELSPGHLQSRTLVEALGRLVSAVNAESRVASDLAVEGEPVPLGGAAEVVLLRTAQEALANVRRHSGADHCGVTLDYQQPMSVVLTIRDDGRGFDKDALRNGYGLDGLGARAAEVGGSLRLTSAPGHGTRVVVEVPR